MIVEVVIYIRQWFVEDIKLGVIRDIKLVEIISVSTIIIWGFN